MSETSVTIDRDAKNGRFLSGCKPGPGRGLGSRNRLSDCFVQDLAACWQQHGVEALERVARDQPEVLLKIVAQLLPRDLNLNLSGTLDASTFTLAFRDAVALLHAEPPKIIEHKNGSNRG
jgi:hypothetical protein